MGNLWRRPWFPVPYAWRPLPPSSACPSYWGHCCCCSCPAGLTPPYWTVPAPSRTPASSSCTETATYAGCSPPLAVKTTNQNALYDLTGTQKKYQWCLFLYISNHWYIIKSLIKTACCKSFGRDSILDVQYFDNIFVVWGQAVWKLLCIYVTQ